MRFRFSLLLLPALFLLPACQSLPLPRGTSAGYKTARLVQERQYAFKDYSPEARYLPEIHKTIQSSITENFEKNNLSIVQGDSDLIVAYLLLRQGNISTSMNQDYFGYGRDAHAILDQAHTLGVIDKNQADTVDQAAIVIDILDARTNKLIFRNFVKQPVLRGIPEAQRKERIRDAVNTALAPFFQPSR